MFLCFFAIAGAEDHSPVRGAFASQYVAHHLVRDGVSNQPTEPGCEVVNNTKNLANLSRLFRQLKPQPLHSESGRKKLLVS